MTGADLRISLLRWMLRIRMVEEAIAERYSEQQMRCPVHLSIGQEAPAAAFAIVVQPGDYAVSTHRGHAHYLAKGGDLGRMIAEIYGKATGCSLGRGGSMHLADASARFMGTSAIVGNSIPVGVGLGLSLQMLGSAQASCIFLGDGAIEEGVFYESANFAAVRHLPVVFLCENNQYSVYSPLSVRQPPGRSIAGLARAIGLSAVSVDGNDVLACHEALTFALSAARMGRGPHFVEFHTHRHREHCGPNWDDHLGYRQPGELEGWLDRDPIKLLTENLVTEGLITGLTVADLRALISDEITDAFAAAEAADFPVVRDFTEGVYA